MPSQRGLKFYSLVGWLLGENPACEDRFSNSLASAANTHCSDNHTNIIPIVLILFRNGSPNWTDSCSRTSDLKSQRTTLQFSRFGEGFKKPLYPLSFFSFFSRVFLITFGKFLEKIFFRRLSISTSGWSSIYPCCKKNNLFLRLK